MTHVKTLFAFLSLSLCLTSALCFADNTRGFYAGAGLSAIDSDEHFSFGSRDLWTTEVLAGYKYNNFLGLELRYGTGASTQSENIYTTVDNEEIITKNNLLKVNHYSTIYYRLESINETGRFYALLGYSDLDLEIENLGYSTSDLSWGLGIGFFMTPKWNLNFEYKHMADVKKTKLTAITASIDYRF